MEDAQTIQPAEGIQTSQPLDTTSLTAAIIEKDLKPSSDTSVVIESVIALDTPAVSNKTETTASHQRPHIRQYSWKPGQSGNPLGRPKGTLSITAAIKRQLVETPFGHTKTNLQLIIDMILKKAITDGDEKMLKNIWNYIDGMPKTKVELDVDKESLLMLTDYFRSLSTPDKDDDEEEIKENDAIIS